MTIAMTRREARMVQRAAASAPLERRFRPDIEGLRGIAVLLVVLYHASVPGLPGGYVGVDVFFVISGFLITSHLVDPVKGPPRLRQFYARRIRRLLPSALIVLLATLVVDRFFGPALKTTSVAHDALSVLSLSVNYHFANAGLDYLQQDASPSPLLHYWSLAVEEQFYLVWPLLVVAVLWFTKQSQLRARRTILIVLLTLIVIASLAVSVQLTTTNAPLAYFSLQSRAWEFGAGALLAVSAPWIIRLPGAVAIGMSWLGLVAIVASAVVLNDNSSFPGYLASIPVMGAFFVIAGGLRSRRGSAETLLGLRWIRFLGSVSYTWYLWHWPVLVLAPSLFGQDFTLGDKIAMVGVSLWLAILTSLLVERPLLRTLLKRIHWYRSALAAGVALALVAGATIVFPPSIPGAAVGTIEARAAKGATGGPVTPSVATAASDTFTYPSTCIAQTTQVHIPTCNIEPDGSNRGHAVAGRVVLLGDSHAAHWYPVVRSIAKSHDRDVEILNKVGCPLADMSVVNPQLKRDYTECTEWREATLKKLTSEARPSVVFISSLNHYRDDGADHFVTKAWSRTMARLAKLNVPVVYLADTPHPATDVPTCIAAHIDAWSDCAFSRTTGLIKDPLETSIAANAYPRTVVIDANSRLCPGTGPTCPAVIDGVLLYRDDSHMTNTAAKSLTGVVTKEFERLEPGAFS